MKIIASNINQNKKAPAFNALIIESGKLAQIVPVEKLGEFKKELIKPKNQHRIENIRIKGDHPMIFIGDKLEKFETGVEGKIFAFYEQYDEPAPFVISKNMSGKEIFESFVESMGNAVDKVRKLL